MTSPPAFTDRYWTGRRWEWLIAHRLLAHGHTIQIPPPQLQLTAAGAAHQTDINIWRPPHSGHIVLEIKSRNIAYTGPHNWPWPTAYIAATAAWDNKTPQPWAVVIVSQQTGHAVAVPAHTQPHWNIRTTTDRRRNHTYTVYEAPRQLLQTWQQLAADLATWATTPAVPHTAPTNAAQTAQPAEQKNRTKTA